MAKKTKKHIVTTGDKYVEGPPPPPPPGEEVKDEPYSKEFKKALDRLKK